MTVVCFTAAGTAAGATGCAKDEPLPVLGTMPAFTMQNQRGESFESAALQGKVSIVNFMFTRCATVCPLFTAKLKRIQDRTASLGEALQLVSISVDPEHDTPAVLAAYAARFKADPTRWSFLTGDPELVKKTATDGLKLALSREGKDARGVPNIGHSQRFVLIDHTLQIRGYYSSEDPAAIDKLVRDAKRLVRSR